MRIVGFCVLREGGERGLLEIANHGYTHCLLEDGLYRPRLLSGNRPYHREFYDWLPERTHREHVHAAQDILGSWLGAAPETLVPPGNVLSPKTVVAAAAEGIRYIPCATPSAPAAGITYVDPPRVLAFHDRDIVRGGVALERLLASRPGSAFVTVREMGAVAAQPRKVGRTHRSEP